MDPLSGFTALQSIIGQISPHFLYSDPQWRQEVSGNPSSGAGDCNKNQTWVLTLPHFI